MKVSNQFKEIIKSYLTNKAENDILFKPVFQKTNKNIDDCINYVLNEVQKSGINAYSDQEIYNMCIHYYDEDSIIVGKSNIKAKVSTSPITDDEDDEDEDIEEEVENKVFAKENMHRLLDDEEDNGLF